MKVLHIQTGMTPAGNAAYRLHQAMRREGIESYVLTYQKTIKRNFVFNEKTGLKQIIAKFYNKIINTKIINKKKAGTYLFSVFPRITFNELIQHAKNMDVIYLHWISGGYLSVKDISKLAQLGKPIIFFMHDMWTMTGGCHHSFDCTQYKTGCKECEMFQSRGNIAFKQNKIKANLFRKYNNLYFVSPSQWMANCAKESSILKEKPVYVIPNIVDESIFKPLDKGISRNILNLPHNKFIITFGCQAGINNKFKGFDYLREAINNLNFSDIQLLIYGSDYNQRTVEQLKYPIIFLGPINDEHVLSLICNASDLFVSPSLAESFGLTFLENTLCGTPVIGFDCTAIPEIVKTGINGYLTKNKNSEDLSQGITLIYNKKITMKETIKYNSSAIIKQHKELIKNILEK